MPIPDNIRARLEQLRMEAALRAEMERRQQQAQANAEAMAQKIPGKAYGGPIHLAVGGQGPKNWLKGSIEPVIEPLKIKMGQKQIDPAERLAQLVQARDDDIEAGNPVDEERFKTTSDALHHRVALNKWIEGNLANYIRKQMATHDDPIRKLAEQGIVHMPPEHMGYGTSQADMVRQKLNAPRLGQSPEAQAWEDATDVSMHPHTVQEMRHNRNMGLAWAEYSFEPWMLKADPDTKVFRPTDNMHAHYLGFDHLVDILKQDLDEGRIRPEQLSKVSIEQAVRRAHEYDQERKKAMAQTALKATEGMPVHKDYGDGFKWLELAMPDKPLPEGYTPGGGNDKYVFDPSGNDVVHPNYQALQDALKYEGDTMGHCVGGYCPDVSSGKSRIFSLRDKNNEPHVTIEVRPQKTNDPSKSIREGVAPPELMREYQDAFSKSGQHSMHFASGFWPWLKDAHPDKFAEMTAEQPPVIQQIYGKSNKKPKDQYIPYVQDFVKGGNWSEVKTIQNAEMRDMNRHTGLSNWLSSKGVQHPRYLTEQEYGKHESDMLLDKLGVQGKAKGGEVKTPSLDTMRLALNKQGMYSPLEKAAMAVPRSKGTPAEFMAEISKQPGFRKEEVEDRKISLPEQKMTKDEFLGHLKNHPAPLLDEKVYRDQSEDEDDGSEGETQYNDWQLPGGQNYREVLLKTPTFPESKDRQIMELEANIRRMNPEDYPPGYVQNMVEGVNKLKAEKAAMGAPYHSSHWQDDPNVLAHMRLSDRYVGDTGKFNVTGTKDGKTRWLFSTGINGTPEQAQQAAKKWEDQGYTTSINQVGGGKKLLHIEEIQSDWHQEGRKKGYFSGDRPKTSGQIKQEPDGSYSVVWDDGVVNKGHSLESAQRAIAHGKASRDGVPDAPFKKNWHELALKHAIGIAAREGYDGIVITPGQQQADRYDLSKHVQNIYHSANADGTFHASVLSPRGQVLWEDFRAPPEKIEATLGKDIAHKIVNGVGEEDNGMRRLDPEDMKVGGEGMKGFYDKIVPAYLNKLGKPHGAQVQMYGMPVNAPNQKSWGIEDAAKFHGMTGSEYLDHPDRPQLEKQFLQARQNQTADLHYFPITDSMRQQIKQEGLPQYDKGGKVDPIEQMRQELAASGNGPIGMDALKQNVKGAWQVLKDVPGNLKRLATDPVAYIRSLPAPTGEQIMNMAGPGNIGFAGMMIGPKARTWHTGRAQMAEAMETAGRTPEEIWKATGTIKGPDGIWRQEISDKGSSFNMIDDLKLKAQEYKDMIEGKKALLAPDKSGQKDFWPKALTEAKRPVREEIAGLKGDLSEMTKNPRTQGVPARWTFEHPELYAAYPELADLPVIQNYKMGPEKGSLYTAGGKLYNMEVNDPRMPRSIALHEMQHAIQNIEGMTPGANPSMSFRAPEYAPLLERIRSNPEEFPHLKTIPRDLDRAAYEWYRRQHGEAEARATQTRQDMTDAERAQSFPYSSYDVKPSDFLTRDPIPYTGKVSEAHGGSVHPLLPDFEE